MSFERSSHRSIGHVKASLADRTRSLVQELDEAGKCEEEEDEDMRGTLRQRSAAYQAQDAFVSSKSTSDATFKQAFVPDHIKYLIQHMDSVHNATYDEGEDGVEGLEPKMTIEARETLQLYLDRNFDRASLTSDEF